jgi:hypothetical protein
VLRPVSRRLGNVRLDDATLLVADVAAPDGSGAAPTGDPRRRKPPGPDQGSLW